MNFRFLALAGPAGAREKSGAEIQSRLDGRLAASAIVGPVSLWTDPDVPLLQNQSGSAAAVGMLFDRASSRRLTCLPDWPDLPRIIIRDFWGPAILITGSGTSHAVMRDPSGAIPVYHARAGELHVYASDAGMLSLALPRPLHPDLGTAAHWLKYPYLRTARTGAVGVSELSPGLSLDAEGEGDRLRQRWTPTVFAKPDCGILEFDDAARLLRSEILRCVPRLAEAGSGVVLQLSGGLDSSIIAASLCESGVPFRAVTFATRSADGDERRYARRVAQTFGVELREVVEDDLDWTASSYVMPLQRPPNLILQSLRRTLLSAVGQNAGLLLDGGGGDNLFDSINTAASAIDAFRESGSGQALAVLRDLAALHGCTLWTAAYSAWRRAVRPRSQMWIVDETFLGPATAAQPLEPHPWLTSFATLPPGKSDHLRSIAGIFHFLPDPAAGEPGSLHPLIAQPLVELCLRIPSWLWVHGGRDRAVARAAFSDILPPDILDRRGKGSLQSLFVKTFKAKRMELRDALVGGRLAAEGLIDAGAVAAYLDSVSEPRDVRYVRILDFAATEQWLASFD